jgi:alkylhydroperoxidase family enzyme
MSRVPQLEKAEADGEAREFFETLESWIAPYQGGESRITNVWKVLAHSPEMSKRLLQLADYFMKVCPWSVSNPRLRELMVLTVMKEFGCDYGLRIHLHLAQELGISQDQIEALEMAQGSSLFDAEEKLVISYTQALLHKNEPEREEFARLVRHFGTAGTVELTGAISFWVMMAINVNALKPDPDPARRRT